MGQPLGVGIIGAGFIGRVHVKAARLAGARVVGVVDSTPAASESLAHDLRVDKVFDQASDLIADRDVQVVHICVPNYLHAQLVADALAAGKHVVCEKPLATTSEDAARLVDLAASAGLIGAVPFAYRYQPMVQEARDRVLRGEIGNIQLVQGSYLQDWLFSPDQGGWRVDDRQSGRSRAFADIGSHLCDLLEWVTGQRITSMIAELDTVTPTRPIGSFHTFEAAGEVEDEQPSAEVMKVDVHTEDLACVMFRMSEGALGTLTVSQVSAGRKNAMRLAVDGSAASLVFDGTTPDRLWFGRLDVNSEIIRDPAFLAPSAERLNILPAGHTLGFLDSFTALFTDVYSAIEGEPTARFPDFDDGLRTVRLTDAVLASAEQRTWVKVAT